MERFFRLVMFFLLAVAACLAEAQNNSAIEFENIPAGGAAINEVFADGNGRMLAVSSNGLLVYDGQIFESVVANGNGVDCDENISSAILYEKDNLMLCTAKGLYRFDMRKDTYAFIYETASLDVQSIARLDSAYMLLGTSTGLVTVNTRGFQTRKLKGAPSMPYYSLLVSDGKVYAGCDNGMLAYDISAATCETVPFPKADNGVKASGMALDKIRGCIWVGSTDGLYKYSLNSGILSPARGCNRFKTNTVMVDGAGNVWIGTDSGLYMLNEENGVLQHYMHNSLDRTSLIDNDVKSLYEDESGNIWIGTEAGVSYYCRNSNFTILRWSHMSKSSEGNRISSILADSDRSLWVGGSNGLIRYGKRVGERGANAGERYLPGMQINDIIEDSDKNIWVLSTEGLYHYDRRNGAFIKHLIESEDGTYAATDCVQAIEDSGGFLLVATRSNGIFSIDRKRLLASAGVGPLVADRHLYTLPERKGLISKNIEKMVIDRNGNLWVASTVDRLTKIYPDNGNIDYFSFYQSEKHLNVKDISDIHCDNEGMIWVIGKGKVDRIDPNNDSIMHLDNELFDGKTFTDMVDKDDNLWLLHSDGAIVVNKQSRSAISKSLPEANVSCIYLDNPSGFIYVGGMDQITKFSPEALLMPSSPASGLTLMAVKVNNQEIYPDREYDGNTILTQSLPYTKEITLNPEQNNLDLEFVGSKSGRESMSRYRYKFSESEDWRETDGQTFHISLNNLPAGTFTLQIEPLDSYGVSSEQSLYELKVKVLPHWYASAWAKLVYALLAIFLICWAAKYYSMKNRLKYERLEKEKVQELSGMKINFLTDVAHELKTPLSLILEPLNKLISTAKGAEQKANLQIVRNNAMHLGKLVNQVLNLRNVDFDNLLEKTYPLELVEFVGSVVATFKVLAENRHIDLEFQSSKESAMTVTDALKMESILRNLISNAIKFTPDGGKIEVRLDVEQQETGEMAILTVTDSGIGIPADDLPKIFERFYQSSHGLSVNKDGSGIGLSVAKTYVNQLKGKIEVASELGKGTAFTITMPIIAPNAVLREGNGEDNADSVAVGAKALIVEDNEEIARFVKENLRKMECRIAHNGKSGFELAKAFNPDVIISDVMMPVMDGIEMSKLLKNNPSTSAIPIILLTAKDDRCTEYDAYGIGVDAFISKPFEIRQLEIRIRQLLKSKLAQCEMQAASEADSRVEAAAEAIATADERFKQEITDIIERNIDAPDLNVQRLAELSGINAKQIYRKLKLATGFTVVDYIKSIRMKKAAQLLRQRRFTVSEVMYMVGFNSSSYFSKCFVEKYGKTPKSYMEEAE
ncbi:MAG: ATP-binding protein [Clostridium sp.]|nr:ATP-binding protein [Clostridium sp.]